MNPSSSAEAGMTKNAPQSSQHGLMSRMAINFNKAGMEGLDKEKINQIIYNSSKGSKFYENEKKKEEQLDKRIQEQKLEADKISQKKLNEGVVHADNLLASLIQQRNLSHSIVHVDMDAFYAAVEMRDDSSLRNKPIAVGGIDMLSTSNYLARKFGVRAAMPGFIGLKLCPNLVMVKPNFEKYTAVSHQIRKVFTCYDPNYSPMSLDEAYLDFGPHLVQRVVSPPSSRTFLLRIEDSNADEVTCSIDECQCDLNETLLPLILKSNAETEESSSTSTATLEEEIDQEAVPNMCFECFKPFPKYTTKVYGVDVEDAVLEMRNRIEQRTRLTASAGIAPNTVLAKICSDKNKPNGQYRVMPDVNTVEEFVKDMPIRKISGIGKVSEKMLAGLGIQTCRDLFHKRGLLYHLFSSGSFEHFMCISLGIGSTTVSRSGERKSMSTESTFSEISDPEQLYQKCEELCQDLASDMKEEDIKGKTVTLKIKLVTFEMKTRSHTLPFSTNDKATVYSAARQLLQTEIKAVQPAPLRLRLLGVRLSKLESQTSRQRNLFDQINKSQSSGLQSSTQNKSGLSTQSIKDETLQCSLPGHSQHFQPYQTLHDSIYQNGVSDDRCIIVEEEEEDFSCPLEQEIYSSYCTNSNIPEPSTSWAKNETQNTSKRKHDAQASSILNFISKDKKKHALEEIQDNVEVNQSNTLDSFDSISTSESQCRDLVPQKTVEIEAEDFSEGSSNSCIENFKGISKEPNCSACKSDTFEHCSSKDSNYTGKGGADVSRSKDGKSELGEKQPSCPVCGIKMPNWDLKDLNDHVDICLNKQTIKDILHYQRSNTVSAAPHSTGPQVQSASNGRKRNAPDNSRNAVKPKKQQKNQPSVLSFFQT